MDEIQIPFAVVGADESGKKILDLSLSLKTFQDRLQAASAVSKEAGVEAIRTLGKAYEDTAADAGKAAEAVKKSATDIAALKAQVGANSGNTASFLKTWSADAAAATKTNSEFVQTMNKDILAFRDYRNAMSAAGISTGEFKGTLLSLNSAQERLTGLSQRLATAQNKWMTANKEEAPAIAARIERINKQIMNQGEAWYTAQARFEALSEVLTKTLNTVPADFERMANSMLPAEERLTAMRTYLQEITSAANEAAAQMSRVKPGTTAYAQANKNNIMFNAEAMSTRARMAKEEASGVLGGASNSALLTTARRLGMISPQVAQVSMGLDTVAGMFGKLSVGAVAAVAGGVAVAGSLAAIGVASVKAAADLQKYEIAFQSLSTHGWNASDKSMVGSQALGKAVSTGMQEYAAGSIYDMDKVAQGTEKLIGYGIDMRNVNKEMKMLGDLALGDSDRLENLAVAYGQVYGQGHARAQEMYQFINAGIPLFDMLATKMHTSTDVVMDMVKKSKISYTDIRDALIDATSAGGRYHDMIASIANLSPGGQWTMLKSQIHLALGELGKGFLPTLTDLLGKINESLARARQTGKAKDIYTTYKSLGTADEYGKEHAADIFATIDLSNTVAAAKRAQDRTSKYSLKLTDTYANNDAARYGTLGTVKLEEEIAKQLANTGTSSVAQQKAFTSAAARLRYMGVSEEDIKKYLLATVFSNFTGNHSAVTVDQLIQSYTPAARTKEQLIGTSAFPTMSIVQTLKNDWAYLKASHTDDPEYLKWLESVYRKRQADESDANLTPGGAADGTGDGAAGTAAAGKRNFLLDEYIAKLRDERAQLIELVPLYSEYARISQMGIADATDKPNQPGLTDEEVKDRTDKAKALYRQNMAYKKMSDAYQSIYSYTDGINAPMSQQELMDAFNSLVSPEEEAQAKAALADQYRKKNTTYEHVAATKKTKAYDKAILPDEKDVNKYVEDTYQAQLTERGKAYASSSLGRLVLAASAGGTSLDAMHQAAVKMYDDMAGTSETNAAFDKMLDNYQDLAKTYGMTSVASDKLVQSLRDLRDAHGATFAYDVVMQIGKITDGLNSETEATEKAREAAKLLAQQYGANSPQALAGQTSYWNTVLGRVGLSASDYAMTMHGQSIDANGRKTLGSSTDLFSAIGGGLAGLLYGEDRTSKDFQDKMAAYDKEQEQNDPATAGKRAMTDFTSATDKAAAGLTDLTTVATGLAGALKGAGQSSGTDASNPQPAPAVPVPVTPATPAAAVPAVAENTAAAIKGTHDADTDVKTSSANFFSKAADFFSGIASHLGLKADGKESAPAADDKTGVQAPAESPITQNDVKTVGDYANNLGNTAERFLKMTGAAKAFSAALKDIAQQEGRVTLNALSDSFYDLGSAAMDGSRDMEDFEDVWKDLIKNAINILPAVLMQSALGAAMSGNWQLALVLAGLGLGTSFLSGLLGTKDTESSDSTELQLLENLQNQFKVMISQFQASIAYLEVMREKYVGAEELAGISAYANGDVFPGSTGLAQGVYQRPTFFRFASGGAFNGVLGEAGAEAIMPLTRLSNGKLGVQAAGGAVASAPIAVTVINNASGQAEVADVQEKTDMATGLKTLSVFIEKKVNTLVATGGLDKALGTRYELQPARTRIS